MRRAHGLFLSQPITKLENISYIFLAQPELKKLRLISQTNCLTVAYLLVNNVSNVNVKYAHEMTARERLRSTLAERMYQQVVARPAAAYPKVYSMGLCPTFHHQTSSTKHGMKRIRKGN